MEDPDLSTLDNDPSVVYALDRTLRLTYCNPAWDRFATENGAPHLRRNQPIGRGILDVIPPVLQRFYRDAFHSVLFTKQPWEHRYECSSPHQYRQFHMHVRPVSGGVLTIHSLAVQHAVRLEGSKSAEEEYRSAQGIVTMCSHCRRTRRAHTAPPVWDWVPAFVEQMPEQCSHGLCLPCFEYHYPAQVLPGA